MELKKKVYNKLVKERKACTICEVYGYCNPSKTKYNINEIGPYTKWANDVNADVLIIAQDFADQASYDKFKGTVQLKKIKDLDNFKEYDTITNFNLRELTKQVPSIKLGAPSIGNSTNVFITNSVLCMKKGEMSTSINSKVSTNCGRQFLKPLIELIQPKVIVTLGKEAAVSVLKQYMFKNPELLKTTRGSFSEIFKSSPYTLGDKLKLYTLYHPSQLGVNNRNKIESDKDKPRLYFMEKDWKGIKID